MKLGIDIGGTKTAAVVLDPHDKVIAHETTRSGSGPDAVLAAAVRIARRAIAEASLDDEEARSLSVGACMPGLVDGATGTVLHAANLRVDRLELGPLLGAELGLPVSVENDVKAAGLGAREALCARSSRYADLGLGYLNLGTGLAAAVVVDGEVVRGPRGAAGEIGHLPVGTGVPCSCGQTGCLETIASGSALARLWPVPTPRPDPFVAAAAGDRRAAAALHTLSDGIATAVQVLVFAAGVDLVVAGGGLTSLGEPLAEAVRDRLRERARRAPVLAALDLPDRFELLVTAIPLAALGAAELGGRARPTSAAGRLS
ncbi:ROK family protein [Propioniciclava coleopterorum]|uniref:ROK family protein n=1 Tax=Propioniciclava coleopterorum TaxID=2714937 RepID=A0A6G7YA38_9ACTN|nr:ROK family protein [Propioniciclava coleopterorum]QIK73508.1 ROK family protein [Propioniciclava coleopterorum]